MSITERLHPSWRGFLGEEFAKPYFSRLSDFLGSAYAAGEVYPPADLVFSAFGRTPPDRVKAVILGQDPYHEPGQAQGLAFYVPPGIRTPPSLLNIAKELASEYPERSGGGPVKIPDLVSWADQGVLLLNAVLTVSAGAAGSHQGKGWEIFTDAVVRLLATERKNLVFMLWGTYARQKGAVIDRSVHCVLECAHPSPLSARRGFFGCNHFRAANAYLESHGIDPVQW